MAKKAKTENIKKAVAKDAIAQGTYYLSCRDVPEGKTVGLFVHDTNLHVLDSSNEEWYKVSGCDRWGNQLTGYVQSRFLRENNG